MPKGEERDLPDVGFGISQLLPIVVAGLKLPKGGLLVVEQPESQLHPRAQSVLGDFFCSLILSERRVLVETHSDALIDRLRLRIATNMDLEPSIGVYSIGEPCDGACDEPKELKLTEEGELRWPAGFMATGIEEEVRIGFIRRQLRNR
jgi:predicted ATPase